jgi:uncharacterized protein with NRDE domain
MGSTHGGRIALLTNVREPDAATAALSRGDLPLRWLEGQMNAAQFLADTDAMSYGGCNLLIGDFLRGEWTWASNRSNVAVAPLNSEQTASGWQTMQLPPGIYALSNALLDTPWPKTLALKVAMTSALTQADAAGDTAVLANILWPALGSSERAALQDLPKTGVAIELEHALSSALIDMPERGYGTRCSTLMWVTSKPNSLGFSATVCEKTMTAQSPKPDQQDGLTVCLTWPLPV